MSTNGNTICVATECSLSCCTGLNHVKHSQQQVAVKSCQQLGTDRDRQNTASAAHSSSLGRSWLTASITKDPFCATPVHGAPGHGTMKSSMSVTLEDQLTAEKKEGPPLRFSRLASFRAMWRRRSVRVPSLASTPARPRAAAASPAATSCLHPHHFCHHSFSPIK